MTFQVIEWDAEASRHYWQAHAAGADYALGDSEIGPSAYFTQRGPEHSHMWAILDGFADGMREASDTSIINIRTTLRLIKGAAA